MRFGLILLLGACQGPPTPAQTPAPVSAAVFLDAGVNPDTAFAREVAALVESAGYAVRFIGAATLTNATLLSTQQFDLLVLPNGRRLPVACLESLQNFLRQGGDLLALGAPLWDGPVFRFRDRWLSREDHDAALGRVRGERPLFDFGKTDFSRWSRSTNSRRAVAGREVVQTPHGPALHVRVEEMDGWETLASPTLERPFPSGHTLTCFRARGGAQTGPLMIEWTERDGSRWIATVELGREWKTFALPPAAFRPWTPPPGRGGQGDSLRLENAVRFTVGVALSHGARPGAHEFWLAEVGTARHPFGDFTLPDRVALPRLESLSPAYQCLPITGPVVVRPSHEKEPLDSWEQPAEAEKLAFAPSMELSGLHPRPRGIGFEQDRPWRWEPLLGAYDAANGDYRGALAALVVQIKAPFRGGAWAIYTPEAPAFYREPLVKRSLEQTLRRLRRGLFLAEGGLDRFGVLEPEFWSEPPFRFKAGASLVNAGRISAEAVEVLVQWHSRAIRDVLLQTNASVPAGGRCVLQAEVRGPRAPLPEWVTVDCRVDGQLVDALRHPISALPVRPDPEARRVTVERGSFFLDRLWRAHGVNYMPSSGIGMTGDYFEYWLGRGAYDPSVIQRDLERIKRMGLNAVSVFIYHRSLGSGHLLDFLHRCAQLDLRVNLSLRPGTPMDFRWAEMKEIIETCRLKWNTTVFAYDLAWEPSHYDPAYQQKHYIGAWREWAQKRYRSVEAAKRAWGVEPEGNLRFEISDFKSLSVPPAEWLTRDGPWRKVVADYRRFLDELVGARYGEARRLVRSIDPYHPVSFRMQHAGDPTHNTAHLLPYDFWGLREAVDIWEPEAYGRIGDWERVKAGRFTADYARLCNPWLPVLWAEMGNTVWDPARMAPSPERMEWTAQFYRDFYRMLIESGADGVFFWWYPGGYRVNENSDFGIINPDGTDRPITKVIREWGPRFLAAPKPPPPDYWISVDRDRDARGLPGLYEAVQEEYWRAVSEGKTPGLKWAKEPGS